jgi:arginyl-tRNA synthetase
MNIFNDVKLSVIDAVKELAQREGKDVSALDFSRVTVEPPRDASHGDMATNIAMILSKPLGAKPRDLAEKIAEILSKGEGRIASCDVAGPGFLNLTLKPDSWHEALADILDRGLGYGESYMGEGQKVNVEYVSANPTGPLTVGHARGAILGDSLANLLEKAGYQVQREYYTNDAGNQVRILGESTYLRYREALGENIGEIPAGHYPGEYLKEVAAKIVEQEGDKWLNDDNYLPFFREFAIKTMMSEIKQDLSDLGIHQDLFYSEALAVQNGSVDKALKTLEGLGLIYTGVLEPPKGKEPPEDWEAKPQTLFRSTDFGDDVDRPVVKSDGANTYFANDIAHYFDIYNMGYPTLINVVGADHGGYVKRAKAAVTAISEGKAELNMPLCAIVRVLANGEQVRMSKRAGTFITLRDVMDQVGAGVMRFIMLTRKAQETLDFDIVKAVEQSKDNPFFYVQYAHARCQSVLRHGAEIFSASQVEALSLKDNAKLAKLSSDDELAMIKLLASWPRLVEQAASAHEPHRIAFYAQEVASALHSWWNKGRDDASMRFLVEGDEDLSLARLALVKAVSLVIASALAVIGVEALDEMRSDVEIEAA